MRKSFRSSTSQGNEIIQLLVAEYNERNEQHLCNIWIYLRIPKWTDKMELVNNRINNGQLFID